MDYVQGDSRTQTVLFPECLDDYVGADNPVRVIDAFVEKLEMKDLGFAFSELNETGRPPFNPKDLMKLYIYGYVNRVRSSRALMRETRRNVELMWLIRRIQPDFRSIWQFRSRNKKAIQRVFRQFTQLMRRLRLFDGEVVAIDGSKFKANNALDRSFSKKRVKEEIKKIDRLIRQYLKDLDTGDRKERRQPEDDGIDDMSSKLVELEEAMQEPEVDEEAGSADHQEGEPRLKRLIAKRQELESIEKQMRQTGRDQVCLSDPEAMRMRGRQGFLAGYNAQIAVEAKHSLITHVHITRDRADNRQLAAMALEAKRVMGAEQITAIADKGYYSQDEIKKCVEVGIKPLVPHQRYTRAQEGYTKEDFTYDPESDTYSCPQGKTLKRMNYRRGPQRDRMVYQSVKACRECPVRPQCTKTTYRRIDRWEHEHLVDDLRQELKRQPNAMQRRRNIVEHPFGFIKHNMGMRSFLSRGQENVGAEFSLAALAFNLRRTINLVGVGKILNAIG